MVRPRLCRRVAHPPACRIFKPAGVQASALENVILTVDELEAIRLADRDRLYQEQAAESMNVSRQTFGRIIESGRRKVAQALLEGKALLIEGGDVEMAEMRIFRCSDCQHSWGLAYGTGRPGECPACKSRNIHREQVQRGPGGPGRGRCRRGARSGLARP